MGYDLNRFDKTNVREEFCCIICQDVLKEPKMIDKCEHIFCCECILQWISCKNNCPIDREPLTLNQLREPMRSFKSLLNQLTIKCEFASNGCQQVFTLDLIDSHVLKCEHNLTPVQCVCGQKFSQKDIEIHQQNCLNFIKSQINEIKLSINDLKFVSIKKTLFQEWIDCNKQYVINDCQMKADMKSETLKMITDGLNARTDGFLDTIVKRFKSKYEGIWFTFVEHKEYNELSSYECKEQSLLRLTIGSQIITIFRSPKQSIYESVIEARNTKIPIIKSKDMSDSMVGTAIQFSVDAINGFDKYPDISNCIQQKMNNKYKSSWNCYVGTFSYGLSYMKKANHALTLGFGSINVIIWQSP